MDYAVVKFGEFGFVPSVGGADKISGDSLQAVDGMASAVRAGVEFGRSVLISAVHASVAGMVHRAVSDVVAVHEVDDRCYGIGVVCGVSVDFDIENVAATCKGMVWRLDFGLVAG